jgi:hypothetical protein
VLEESAVFVFKGEPTLKMEAAGLAITISHAHISYHMVTSPYKP